MSNMFECVHGKLYVNCVQCHPELEQRPSSSNSESRELDMADAARPTPSHTEGSISPSGGNGPAPSEKPCATCNDDPAVCATVPGLRHCEKAMRGSALSEYRSSEKDERESGFNACCFKSLCLENARELKIANLKNASSLANNLCPDHRDKQKGRPCLACEIDRLERDLAQTRLERDAARNVLARAIDRERLANMRADQAEEARAETQKELEAEFDAKMECHSMLEAAQSATAPLEVLDRCLSELANKYIGTVEDYYLHGLYLAREEISKLRATESRGQREEQ